MNDLTHMLAFSWLTFALDLDFRDNVSSSATRFCGWEPALPYLYKGERRAIVLPPWQNFAGN